MSAWLTCFYWQHLGETDAEGFPNVGLMVPTCNVLAYLLGPVALAEPPWVAIGMTVAAVLFLTSREALHGLARRIELSEIVNAGRFLLLTGFALPLLPNTPVTDLTSITPRQVWLAMVAVCSVSYASYLLQRYVAPSGATLLAAVLGGVYSSTATTVVLARRTPDQFVGGAGGPDRHNPRHLGDVPAAAYRCMAVQSASGVGAGTDPAGAVRAGVSDGRSLAPDWPRAP